MPKVITYGGDTKIGAYMFRDAIEIVKGGAGYD